MSQGIFRVTAGTSPLRQGEILSDLFRYRLDPETVVDAQPRLLLVKEPFAIVLTQDCDLESDYRNRAVGTEQSDKLLNEVLFCRLIPAEKAKPQVGGGGWERVRKNDNPRYHFLQQVTPGCDGMHALIPESVADFKQYFTVPTAEVYKRVEIGQARRRCALLSPYMEHFCCRYANYLSRIGLPEQHTSI